MTGTRNLIILAEDEANFREEVERLLSKLGFEVRTFENGKLALEAIQGLSDNEKARAILVTDLEMPKLGGLQLLDETAQLDIPKLVWSSGMFNPQKTRVIRAGAHHAISKPFIPNESGVLAMIEQTLKNYEDRHLIIQTGIRLV